MFGCAVSMPGMEPFRNEQSSGHPKRHQSNHPHRQANSPEDGGKRKGKNRKIGRALKMNRAPELSERTRFSVSATLLWACLVFAGSGGWFTGITYMGMRTEMSELKKELAALKESINLLAMQGWQTADMERYGFKLERDNKNLNVPDAWVVKKERTN
jgi:hypothetical protein